MSPIESSFQAYSRAVAERDVDLLVGLYSDSVSAEFETLRETSSDGMACASALVTYAATAPDGRLLKSSRERLTWILALGEEGWRIVQSHGSVPLDPETVRALADEPRTSEDPSGSVASA